MAFEREVGFWGIGLSDRVLRFLGASAVFHLFLLPFTYWIRAHYLITGHVGQGKDFPYLLWLYAAVYVLAPDFAGRIIGKATRERRAWATFLTGKNPAPRAWDHLFGDEPSGWIRMRMKSGRWLGGAFAPSDGRRPYAAGYPHAGDLYLADVAQVDAETGEFVLGGTAG